MDLRLCLQKTVTGFDIPSNDRFKKWVSLVLGHQPSQKTELTIRIVDTAEIRQLNAEYRQKDKPTNVLSFPSEIPEAFSLNVKYLGDIVICAPVVVDEAKQQGKVAIAHWAHLTIHGVLHLLGYDHEQEQEAAVMEAMEIELLGELGYPNPYLEG